jgi:hypothetical protein
MALRPGDCLTLLATMSRSLEGANWRLQFVEQGLRVLAGAALLVRAPLSRLPLAFAIAGCLLVVTSMIIMVAPIRWHGAYGTWWVRRLSPPAIRCLAVFPAIVAVALVYAAI